MSGATEPEIKGNPATLERCRDVLSSLPFFDHLHETDVPELALQMRAIEFVAGTTIFYEDDDPDAVYFIEKGAVEVFKSDGSGRKLLLAVLRDHGVIGEMGLLLKAPRTASARTLSHVHALRISNADVNTAIGADSLATFRLMLAISRVLAQRLSVVDRKLFEMCDKTHEAQLAEYTDLNRSLLELEEN